MGLENARFLSLLTRWAMSGLNAEAERKLIETYKKQGVNEANAKRACSIFKDGIVTDAEQKEIVSRFMLKYSGQRWLRRLVGSDGRKILQARIKINKALAVLRDNKKSTYDRRVALQFLANHGGPRIKAALIAAFNGNDIFISIDALRILVRRRERSIIPKLLQMAKSRPYNTTYLYALGELGVVQARPLFLSALKKAKDYPGLAANAAIGLGIIGDRKSVPTLIRLLKRNSFRSGCRYGGKEYNYVRLAVLVALKALKDPRAVPAIISAYRDAKVYWNDSYYMSNARRIWGYAGKALLCICNSKAKEFVDCKKADTKDYEECWEIYKY